MPRLPLRTAALLLTLGTLIGVVYESTQAIGEPGVLILTTNQSYVAHFGVYAFLAFAALAAMRRLSWTGLILVIALVSGLGITMELIQSLVPSRAASTNDALADIAGAIAGALTYILLLGLFAAPVRQPARKR